MSQNNNSSSSSVAITINPASSIKPNEADGHMAAVEGGTLLITMGMFFDGTGNNKENIKSGKHKDAFLLEKVTISYRNGFSNVARAWPYYQGSVNGELLDAPTGKVNDPIMWNDRDNDGGNLNVYIEGIGTNNRRLDDIIRGLAIGTDLVSGIKPRVRFGTKEAAKAIMNHDKVKKVIKKVLKIEVTFDVFGFSRGAAAARHFIYLNTKQYPEYSSHNPHSGYTEPVYKSYFEYYINQISEQDRKIEVKINWRFAGLYETVSSHGGSFEDDLPELGLDAIQYADSVNQLVAADEYRKNFSLTTTRSVPNATVITLPGVHSDIGGGYPEKSEEDIKLYEIRFSGSPLLGDTTRTMARNQINEVRNWFVKNGWYEGELDNNSGEIQFREVSDGTPSGSGAWVLKGKRTNIGDHYSYIPLKIMTDLARDNGVEFNKNLYNSYRVYSDAVIGSIYDLFNGKSINLSALSSYQLKQFRHDYLHWSSEYGSLVGMGPRLNENLPNHPKFERDVSLPG